MDTLSEQGLANVLNACAKLEKARLAVERLDNTGDASRGWRFFTSRVASLAPRAGDQGLSVALHALTLCGDDARASVDEGGWRAFETAAEESEDGAQADVHHVPEACGLVVLRLGRRR